MPETQQPEDQEILHVDAGDGAGGGLLRLGGDGRSPLPGRFDMQRAVIHRKCEGLSEADAHRAVLPEQQCAVTDETVAAHALEDVGRHPGFRSAGPPSPGR
ncbi:hypothetical protein ABZV67_19750 [Streptomyces sp. NPDC005065]|uniref:hypothetical protein n=1 Tax=unclassified Streptomyces TaxID=2593676 RepID=UPI0033B74D5A